ncbi:protein RarD [Pilimelia terevasa]|uniref:Protein RarD n=1 Tax=Pilimelia terevasa TaxID=53372 RepID=A0A8J3BN03_9ACTN|nr:EamA family transporter RarD [Pilimelia terevasa]GGK20995.1 protein RarD [Pilimelia terevasa]
MAQADLRRGYLYAVGAYAAWGGFPLYFHLLAPATALEILAHRVVWAVPLLIAVVALTRDGRYVGALLRRPRTLAGVALGAALIAVNWALFAYGATTAQVVEVALGYFVNPLVTVLFGVAVLGERLRDVQWAAVGVGAAAVAVLTVDYGRVPYLALGLAVTFAAYGLVKKRLALPAAPGLCAESLVLVLPCAAYLAWLLAGGRAAFGQVSPGHTALLVLSGAATAVPLLLFAGAANRLPLVVLGPLQYLVPVLHLVCGVLVLGEPMPPARLAGFALVWVALALLTADAVRQARRTPDPAPTGAGPPRADAAAPADGTPPATAAPRT